MIPYFLTAAHQKYARFGLYYLHDKKKLPATMLKKVMQGEHVARHYKVLWNRICTEMYI